MKNKFVIPSFKFNLPFPVVSVPVSLVSVLLIIYLTRPSFNMNPTDILLILCMDAIFIWAFVSLLIGLIKSKKEFVEVSDSGVAVSKWKNKVLLNWDDIEYVGFQGLVAKRLGLSEVFSYMTIKLKNTGLEKMSILSSSKEFGFFLKSGVLSNYEVMPKENAEKFGFSQTPDLPSGGNVVEKGDIYINMKFSDEADVSLIELFSSKNIYLSNFPSLRKL